LLHQLARRIIDGRDMIGIDGVAQTKSIGEKRQPKQHGMTAQRDETP
jgi:hypothetical protein